MPLSQSDSSALRRASKHIARAVHPTAILPYLSDIIDEAAETRIMNATETQSPQSGISCLCREYIRSAHNLIGIKEALVDVNVDINLMFQEETQPDEASSSRPVSSVVSANVLQNLSSRLDKFQQQLEQHKEQQQILSDQWNETKSSMESQLNEFRTRSSGQQLGDRRKLEEIEQRCGQIQESMDTIELNVAASMDRKLKQVTARMEQWEKKAATQTYAIQSLSQNIKSVEEKQNAYEGKQSVFEDTQSAFEGKQSAFEEKQSVLEGKQSDFEEKHKETGDKVAQTATKVDTQMSTFDDRISKSERELELLRGQQFLDEAKAKSMLESRIKRLKMEGAACLIAGRGNSEILDTIEIYNPNRNLLNDLLDIKLKVPRKWHNCVIINDNLYIIGGEDGSNSLSSVETIDPYNNTALECSLVMNHKRHRAAAATKDGCVFVFGGSDASSDLSSSECLNVSGGVCEYIAQMPSTRCYHTAECIGDCMYLIGGGVDGTVSNSALVYHPATNEYTTDTPNLPEARCRHASAVQEGTIVVTGGFDGSKYLSSCQRYDPKVGNKWMQLADMNQKRLSHALVNIGGRLLALGGDDGSDLDTVEVYHSRMDKWTVMETKLLQPRYAFAAVAL